MFHHRRRGKKGMIHVYWREDGKRRSRAVSTDPEAVTEFERKLADRLHRQRSGLTLREVPFSQLCEEYINEYSYATKRPRSIDRDRRTIKLFRDRMPHVAIVEQFNAGALNVYKGIRRKDGAKDSTINRELGTLKNMIKFACVKRYKDHNDAGEVTFYEVSDAARERVLTDAELSRLLAAAPHPYRTAFMLGAYAGLRSGEACHMLWENVGDEIIKIRPVEWEEINRDGGREKMKWFPKNKPSRRDVPLHPVLRKYLRGLKHAGPWVVCHDDGVRLKETVLASMVTKFRRRIKLQGFCFHVLRHTFVSRMAAGNADTLAISKIIGHSSTRITETVYTHLKDTYYHEHINKLAYQIKKTR